MFIWNSFFSLMADNQLDLQGHPGVNRCKNSRWTFRTSLVACLLHIVSSFPSLTEQPRPANRSRASSAASSAAHKLARVSLSFSRESATLLGLVSVRQLWPLLRNMRIEHGDDRVQPLG
jgi:hypothetical protein